MAEETRDPGKEAPQEEDLQEGAAATQPEAPEAERDEAQEPAPEAEQEDVQDPAPEPSEVEGLRAELEAAREEARRNHDQMLREAAETENYKKRVAREKQDAIRYANEALVRDLLPVIDDLERAVQHGEGDAGALRDGVELVLRGCLEALQKHGVTRVTAKGQPFDPEKHEAYAHVETDEYEANMVMDEVRHGYYLADRLLRASLVSVAKSAAPQPGGPVEGDPADD